MKISIKIDINKNKFIEFNKNFSFKLLRPLYLLIFFVFIMTLNLFTMNYENLFFYNSMICMFICIVFFKYFLNSKYTLVHSTLFKKYNIQKILYLHFICFLLFAMTIVTSFDTRFPIFKNGMFLSFIYDIIIVFSICLIILSIYNYQIDKKYFFSIICHAIGILFVTIIYHTRLHHYSQTPVSMQGIILLYLESICLFVVLSHFQKNIKIMIS